MPTPCIICLHILVGLNKLITYKGTRLKATLTIAYVFSLKHQRYLLSYGALLEERKKQQHSSSLAQLLNWTHLVYLYLFVSPRDNFKQSMAGSFQV